MIPTTWALVLAQEAFRFEGLGLGASDAPATGDVVAGLALPCHWKGIGSVVYDKLAIYPFHSGDL